MRSSRVFHAVDSHTEGMPTRVVTSGVGVIPGSTMNERRLHLIEHLDHLRLLLMTEPRGHAAMSGAILQPPTRETATGASCTSRCPAASRCAVTAPSASRPCWWRRGSSRCRSRSPRSGSTPRRALIARVDVEGGRAASVTIENVPSYVERLDASIEVPGYGTVPYSLAFGGNFYAVVELDALGLPFDRERQQEILQAGLAIMGAINDQDAPSHPEISGVDHCHHVEFLAPGSDARLSRHAMAIHPGWFDRSPCGTGTSARMAELWARGKLAVGDEFVNESFIGSRFTGRILRETTVAGRPAIVPAITGRAWITGMGQYLLDPSDPFPSGFRF